MRRHKVCRKSTTALISCSVKIRFRPNGGITVCGLRLVSSVRMATRSLRSGYLLLISFSSGPMVPGRSPPLMTWQVRQLPLPRSNAIFWPSAAADCAWAGPARPAPISSASASAGTGLAEECVDQRRFPDVMSVIRRNIGGQKHKRHRLTMWTIRQRVNAFSRCTRNSPMFRGIADVDAGFAAASWRSKAAGSGECRGGICRGIRQGWPAGRARRPARCGGVPPQPSGDLGGACRNSSPANPATWWRPAAAPASMWSHFARHTP